MELPLTVTESVLLEVSSYDKNKAMLILENIIKNIKKHAGLITLLWHNTYFNEPEFAGMEQIYRDTLWILQDHGAYIATGAEITTWWDYRASIHIKTERHGPGWWQGSIETSKELNNLALEVFGPEFMDRIQVQGTAYTIQVKEESFQIILKHVRSKVRILIGKENVQKPK